MVRKIAIFDLDKTILKIDSFKLFIIFFFFKFPKLTIYFPIIIFNFLKFFFFKKKKFLLKEKILILFFNNLDDKEIIINCKKFSFLLKKFYVRKNALNEIKNLNKKKIKTLIITASPDIYVKKLSLLLNCDYISTNINLKNNKKPKGSFLSKNCYGEEKVKRLKKTKFFRYHKIFYTDHISDLPMIKICEENNLINFKHKFNFNYGKVKKKNW